MRNFIEVQLHDGTSKPIYETGRYLLKVISFCSNTLVSVDVSGCFQTDDATIAKLLKSCHKLQNLNIKNCRKLTDITLESIVSLRNPLDTLNIGGNFNMTPQGVQNFFLSYPHVHRLREMHVSGLMINDDILVSVAAKCTGLTSFGLGYSDVSESGLSKLLSVLGPQFVKLNVSWLSTLHAQISTAFLLEVLATYCPRLIELDVSGMKNFTSANLTQLLDTRIMQVSRLIAVLASTDHCLVNSSFRAIRRNGNLSKPFICASYRLRRRCWRPRCVRCTLVCSSLADTD